MKIKSFFKETRDDKRKFALVATILVAVCVVGFVVIRNGNPRVAFKRKFGFKLPVSAEVIYSKYGIWDSDYYDAKILLDEYALGVVEEKFDEWFEGVRFATGHEDDDFFNRIFDWWDLDGKCVVKYYESLYAGNNNIFGYGPKTALTQAFIEKKDGQITLYILGC
ncbi:MAG: hypothetical protein LBN99_07095 [Oscillospiraceae bacterium]|jgi:hypothetical protein|nr:hypothetical protein [Oscillospiraceae bacterium]